MTVRRRVVVVTGLSGAGKSTTLHALEDLGYFCVDNLPTSLVKHVVQVCEAGGISHIALGIDARVGSFLDGAVEALESAREGERDVVVLFLDASDEALLRRFHETRRPHPLSSVASLQDGAPATGGLAVLDGVELERERLAPLRAQATLEIDTTRLSVHALRRQVVALLGTGTRPRMLTRILSFGFKYGVPIDADLLFDARFLDNPYFVADLRPLTGRDAAVRDYILSRSEALEFIEKIEELLTFCIPRYEREGKSYLTIAVGCTGGRHRSVALADVLTENLAQRTGLAIVVVHRDLSRSEREHPAPSTGP